MTGQLHNRDRLYGLTSLLIFCGLFMVSIFLAGGLAQIAGSLFAVRAEELLAMNVCNTLFMFGLPCVALALVLRKNPISFLSLDRLPAANTWIWGILLFIIGLPALNQIIYYNANLPTGDSGIWQLFREWENSAAHTTEEMLSLTSPTGLAVSVIIVGLLTGFCEELFFRATLQKVLRKCGLGENASIWWAAAVFSLLHFQFFGFVPRLLLGAYFGYLMRASGSVWLPASVHAINNSIVVFVTWLSLRGADVAPVENFGVSAGGFPIEALFSAVLFIGLFWKLPYFIRKGR